MSKHILISKFLVLLLIGLGGPIACSALAHAQMQDEPGQLPKPILLTEPKQSMDERMDRKITLDVRDMNIVDVIKFLANKGDFNVVISPSVEGHTTVLLHDVSIKDALDIIIISNKLAYHIEDDIVQIMTAGEYEALYGKQFGDQTEVSVVHLQYAKPSYVLAALDNMRSNVGKIVIDEDTGSVVLIDTPEAIARMKKAIAEIEQPLKTVVYSLKFAKADVVAEKLRSRIDAKAVGSITADERSNEVLVRVFPGRRAEVDKIIHGLDVPTKEVLIQARVLQIILKPQFDAGIDWSAVVRENGKQKFTFQNLSLGEGSLPTTDNLATNYGKIGVGSVNNPNDFMASIRALQQVSDTKILSNPQILVTNNDEAKIHIGDTVPYIVSTVNGTGDNAIVSEDVRFIDVGLKLDVIPTINDDGMVTMRLRPEISSVDGSIQATQGKIPEVNTTEVETSVMVKDGQTVVLAGLRKEEKSHTKKGVPGLMSIPYLGNIFSRTSDAITSTEIVILITPHIVTGTDDYNTVNGTIKPAKTYDNDVQPKDPPQTNGGASK